MRATAEVARKFGGMIPIGFAWALGTASIAWASLPANQQISTGSAAAVLKVTVPESGWHLRIERIFELNDQVWILGQLQRPSGPAAQLVQTVQATLPTGLPAKSLHVFIAGKTWSWPNPEPYEFVATLATVINRAGAARVLYSAKSD